MNFIIETERLTLILSSLGLIIGESLIPILPGRGFRKLKTEILEDLSKSKISPKGNLQTFSDLKKMAIENQNTLSFKSKLSFSRYSKIYHSQDKMNEMLSILSIVPGMYAPKILLYNLMFISSLRLYEIASVSTNVRGKRKLLGLRENLLQYEIPILSIVNILIPIIFVIRKKYSTRSISIMRN